MTNISALNESNEIIIQTGDRTPLLASTSESIETHKSQLLAQLCQMNIGMASEILTKFPIKDLNEATIYYYISIILHNPEFKQNVYNNCGEIINDNKLSERSEEELFVMAIEASITSREKKMRMYLSRRVPTSEEFKYALEREMYGFILQFTYDWKTANNKVLHEVYLPAIFNGIRVPSYYEAKLFLLKELISKVTYQQGSGVIKQLEKSIMSESTATESVLSHVANPIKIGLLCVDIIRTLEHRFESLKFKADRACLNIENILEELGENITKYKEMCMICRDKDLKERSVLQLLAELKQYKLLDNRLIRAVIREEWETHKQISPLWEISSIFRIIFKNENQSLLSQAPWKPPKHRSHMFSYSIWKNSPRSRYFTKAFFELIITILYQFLTSHTISLIKNVFPKCMPKEPQIPSTYELEQVNSWTDATFWMITLYYGLIFMITFEIVFLKKTRQKLIYGSFETLLHFIEICNVFGISISYGIAQNAEYSNEDVEELQYCNTVRYLVKNAFDLQVGIFIAILWIGMLIRLRVIDMLGPLLTSLGPIFWQILRFLLILITETLAFACIGTVAFGQCDPFDTMVHSFMTLFKALLGDYTFSPSNSDGEKCYDPDKSSQRMRYYASYIYMFTFLVLNIMIAMNFLIALLADAYQSIRKSSRALYLTQIIKQIPFERASPEYSSLVSSWFPLSLIYFPFYVWLCYRKTRKERMCLNNILMHSIYFLMGLVVRSIIFALSLGLSPIALILVIIRIIFPVKDLKFEKVARLYERHGMLKFIYSFLMCLATPFILIAFSVCDMWMFFYYAYVPKNMHKDKHTQLPDEVVLTMENYRLLREFFRVHRGEDIVDLGLLSNIGGHMGNNMGDYEELKVEEEVDSYSEHSKDIGRILEEKLGNREIVAFFNRVRVLKQEEENINIRWYKVQKSDKLFVRPNRLLNLIEMESLRINLTYRKELRKEIIESNMMIIGLIQVITISHLLTQKGDDAQLPDQEKTIKGALNEFQNWMDNRLNNAIIDIKHYKQA